MRRWMLGAIAPVCLSFAGAAAAQVPPTGGGVDAGTEEAIVVSGVPPRCRPRAGDPQDAVDLSAASNGAQQIVRIDPATGKYALFPDDYPLETRDQWQRDGTRLDQYLFRTPAEDDELICIGARKPSASGFAQLRRAFPARPLWSKYVILTLEVATRNVEEVDMWIAAGAPLDGRRAGTNIVAGGAKRVPLVGNFRRQRLNFLMGPIPCMAVQVSYGVTLRGGGDVWLSKPRFVEVPEASLSQSMRDRLHGAEMLKNDPICRHYINGDDLWRQVGGNIIPLDSDDHITTGSVLFSLGAGGLRAIQYNKQLALGLIEF